MDSCRDTACAVGCPIRISTDQSLLAAPHGFSQRATSFIASWCQGIHRMPFSCSGSDPRVDPGTAPGQARDHHAQKPSSGSVVSPRSSVVRNDPPVNRQPLRDRSVRITSITRPVPGTRPRTSNHKALPSASAFRRMPTTRPFHASELPPLAAGRLSRMRQLSRSDMQPANEQPPIPTACLQYSEDRPGGRTTDAQRRTRT
jgi:hypothetical protein